MPEQALAILEKIPNHKDIQDHDDENGPGEAADQFIDLDGNEERRFADGKPPGPLGAEHQPNPFHQRKQAVDQGADREMHHLGFGEISHAG